MITNDIYTREDAEFLLRQNVLPVDRVIGVETGGCPHTAIRDDTSMNMAAVIDLEKRHPDLKLILIESGGDNLSATFSPELLAETVCRVAQSPELFRRMSERGLQRCEDFSWREHVEQVILMAETLCDHG